jgi:hypothetical protein
MGERSPAIRWAVACHARESGHPEERDKTLDSRLRGNDIMVERAIPFERSSR